MALRQNDLGNDDIKQLVRHLAIPSMLAQLSTCSTASSTGCISETSRMWEKLPWRARVSADRL